MQCSNNDDLINLFGGAMAPLVKQCWSDLINSSDFHSPMAWRSSVPGLCSLDYAGNADVRPRTCVEMMSISKFFGGLSLDLRDVAGLGHARILALIKNQAFDRLLQRIAAADSYCAVCITEPECGSDLRNLTSQAIRVNEGYRLSGRKQYISRLRQADHYIVFASVVGVSPGLTAFVVRADSLGLKVSDMNSSGLRGCSWGALDMTEVFVPQCCRVGGEGQGFSLFSTHFSFWRCMMAASALGAAQCAMNRARQRLSERRAFGDVIGRFTHLQQDYVKHASRIHMCWLLVTHAAARLDDHSCGYVDAAMAKAESVECALDAVRWCQLIHGASGYLEEFGLTKTVNDLIGLTIADGTTDVLRGQAARGLLGESLYQLSLGRDDSNVSMMRGRQLW